MIALAPEPLIITILALAVAFWLVAMANETLRDQYAALRDSYDQAFRAGRKVPGHSEILWQNEAKKEVCDLKIHGDHTVCRNCNLFWSTNTPNPPICMMKGNQAK